MHSKQTLAVGVALGLCITAISGQADAGFRCSRTKIAERGDSTAVVLAKCGEPESKEVTSGGGAEDRRESWTYRDFHDSSWIFILHFRAGRLVEFENAGRL